MLCPKCYAENPDNNLYCGRCGAPLIEPSPRRARQGGYSGLVWFGLLIIIAVAALWASVTYFLGIFGPARPTATATVAAELGGPLATETVPLAPSLTPTVLSPLTATIELLPPTATEEPMVVPTDTSSLTPQRALRYVVGNTGGDGVYIRRTPKMADKIVAWPDGMVMEVVGEDTQAEGVIWKRVKDPKGNIGWVPSQYLIPVLEGSPTPTKAAPLETPQPTATETAPLASPTATEAAPLASPTATETALPASPTATSAAG